VSDTTTAAVNISASRTIIPVPQINATCKNLVFDAESLLNHKPGRTLAPISPPPTFVYHNTKTNVRPRYLPYQSTSHHRKKTKPHAGLQAMFVDIS